MKRLKSVFKMNTNSSLCLVIAVASIIAISSCGSYTTSVSPEDAYDAGYTIGRLLRGE